MTLEQKQLIKEINDLQRKIDDLKADQNILGEILLKTVSAAYECSEVLSKLPACSTRMKAAAKLAILEQGERNELCDRR